MKVIVISGPAGSGKTMALQAIKEQVAKAGHMYVSAYEDQSIDSITRRAVDRDAKFVFVDDCPDDLLERLQCVLPDVTAYVVQGSTYVDPMVEIEEAGCILQTACHGASFDAGWWADMTTGNGLREECRAGTRLGKALVAEKLALIHSEVSEAMEAHRKGLMDDKLPERPGIEVELADAVIRIADLAGALGLDLGGAIAEKMSFNASREDHKLEARQAAGGKAY